MLDIFSGNVLSASEISTDKVLSPSPWATIIICAALFLFTLTIISYRRKLTLLLRALFSPRHLSLMIRENRIIMEPVFFLTLLFDIMVMSAGTLFIMRHTGNELVGIHSIIGLWGILLGVMLLLYWLKFFVNFIYSKLFDRQKDLYFINLYKFAFLTDAAVVLFIFLILSEFTGIFALMYAYIPVFAVLYVVYLYKLFKINPREINLFNFFIYFCTLEILPYVLLVKISTIT